MTVSEVDLCIIGSGSGNSLLDERFAGWTVAMVDSGIFGGTCLNVGCIPTKMFVLPADLASSPELAGRLGVDLDFRGADFPAIRDRIFGRIDPISSGGLQWRASQPGVTVHQQHARFVDAHTVELADGHRIRARQFVLAAGSRARALEVEGVDGVADLVHTSDTVMRLPHLPESLVILGGGFIAAEFAHVFQALGSRVTVVHRRDTLLRSADATVAERFTQVLARRVDLQLEQTVTRLERDGDRVVVHTVDRDGTPRQVVADVLLNATGRIPNGDRLEVGAAGVAVDEAGFVVVDAHQRTSVDHIWALGDVCSPWMLKHVANHEMRVVQHNLLHPEALTSSDHRFVPHAVFSDPQIGQVGLTEAQARATGRPVVVKVQDYGSVAYGWALEDTDHLVKLIADAETRQLVGAHVMGPQAATLVQLCVQAMSFGQTVDEVARGQYWIHPALTEVIENALLGLVEHLDALQEAQA